MPVVTDYTALLTGSTWTGIETLARPAFVTFSFPTIAHASHAAGDVMGGAFGSFQAFDAADQAVARQALSAWGNACGLTFLEVAPGNGDLTFSWYDFSASIFDGAGGIAYYPFGNWDFASYPDFWDHTEIGGDVLFNLDFAAGGLPALGLLLHEIGHALGFKHPFETFGSHDETLDPALDNTTQTVMSYTGAEPTQLGALDRAAAAAVYGAAGSDGTQVGSWNWNAATETLVQKGRNTSETIQGTSVRDNVVGKGGDDRILGLQGVDTLAGGDGRDSVYGGGGNDILRGDAGDDTIRGGDGVDKLTGGTGNDFLSGEAGFDKFAFDAGFGDDIITDFTDTKEKLNLSTIAGINSFADVTVSDWFGDARVTVAGHGTITLWEVTVGQISAADFIF